MARLPANRTAPQTAAQSYGTMGVGAQAFPVAQTEEPQVTVLVLSSEVRDRLGDLHGRLLALRDHLLGAQPREVGKADAPEPLPSVRHNLYVARDIGGDLAALVSELEHML